MPAKQFIAPQGSIVKTPTQIDREQRERERKREQFKEQQRIKGQVEKHRVELNRLGNWVAGTNHKMDLTPNEITTLMLLSTYMGQYNSQILVTSKGRNISKKECMALLDQKSSTFYKTWSRLTDGGYLSEGPEGIAITSNFWFGVAPEDAAYRWTRIYKQRFRKLYRTLPKTKRKYVGYLFLALDYLHPKYNIFCRNPDEKDLNKIKPLSIKELLTLAGVNPKDERTIATITKLLRETTFGENEHFCTIVRIENTNTQMLMLNPRVWYRGKWSQATKDTTMQMLMTRFDSNV